MPEITFKRGTDTARTDGTLGVPAQGEPIYSTSTKALFVGDGGTDGGIPATVPATLLVAYNSVSQDVNALATDNLLLWDTNSLTWGVDITHDVATNTHKFIVNTTGVYELSASLALSAQASAAARYNGIMRFKMTSGTFPYSSQEIGSEGKGGYIRDATGQDETSLHITPFAYLFTANDFFFVKVDRESTPTTAVDSTPNASLVYIKRLR
tara:strand:- start:1331 stop:1960 length:630 start_codon:yes stop_codon:yes gene_type:complete